MSHHYSITSFFRHMPNILLARYFVRRELLGDLDFGAMKETKPEELLVAWLALPKERRNDIDTEFQEIFEMSCEKGFRAILDEAKWQLRDDSDSLTGFIEKLSALPGHYHRAMVTFLDHQEFWKGATHFHHADRLPYWRKRKNMGHEPAAVDDESVQRLARLISGYFHQTEGRGRNCVVEPFRRGELDYFFAYPEDYSQQSVEWVDGKFDRRPHNPAFEVVFIYSQEEGTLDLNFRGDRKAVEPLQGMFATAVLKKDELPVDPKDERVYDLNLLRNQDFSFVYDAGSGIDKVAVKKLRLSSRTKKGERITLETNPTNPHAIYDLLEKVGESGKIDLENYNVTQVELTASVVSDPTKAAKKVTIRITHPNSCSLKYDERDLKLRAMLANSGIEPIKPEDTADE